MLSDKITVCIFAWNEESRVLRGISNFSAFFPVLVVDNYSTDGTRDVVEGAGYKVVKVKNPGFIETPEVMDAVIAACDTEYLLIASLSEFVPFALLRKYADVANAASHDVVRAYRVCVTAGAFMPLAGKPGAHHEGELRFFRKGSVDYAGNKVHGRGRVIAPAERILNLGMDESCHFYQFRDYDCSHTELKHRVYNDTLARQRYEQGERFSWFKMVKSSTRQFLSAYIKCGLWRFGMLGFIHSFHRWYMEVGICLRVWEWENDFSSAAVVRRNNEVRVKMEADIQQFFTAQK